jgi:hypothetical protein
VGAGPEVFTFRVRNWWVSDKETNFSFVDEHGDVFLSRTRRRKYPLSSILDSVDEDNTLHDTVTRYCKALGRRELVASEVEVDYFPVMQMPVDPFNAGLLECGFLWKPRI